MMRVYHCLWGRLRQFLTAILQDWYSLRLVLFCTGPNSVPSMRVPIPQIANWQVSSLNRFPSWFPNQISIRSKHSNFFESLHYLIDFCRSIDQFSRYASGAYSADDVLFGIFLCVNCLDSCYCHLYFRLSVFSSRYDLIAAFDLVAPNVHCHNHVHTLTSRGVEPDEIKIMPHGLRHREVCHRWHHHFYYNFYWFSSSFCFCHNWQSIH
mmetsp:Transcript_16968/g.35203  ORF Transcript_16968/g.35203 Transcript_16968/m.35203 type:complete len:209 (-) Transcript_16968:285-911(-)